MGQTREEIFYSGTVQGVGFRYMVRQIASRFEVTGFVRNLRDRRVQLVVEGETDEMDRFLAAVDDSLGGYIRDREIVQSVGTGQFVAFGIQF